MKNLFFIIITVLSICLATQPFVMAGEKETGNGIRRAVFKIKADSRWKWFSAIRYELICLEGFSGMAGNVLRRIVAVDFSAPLTVEAISSRIAGTGYTAELKTVKPISIKQSFSYIASPQGGGSGCSCSDP